MDELMNPAKPTNTSQVADINSEYRGTAFKKSIPNGPPFSDPIQDASGRMSSKDAIKIVTTYCPSWPNYFKVMKDPPTTSLHVPSYFGIHLPKGPLKFNSQGKSWMITANYQERNGSHTFTDGWSRFIDDNEIRRGDVCIFERVGSEVNVMILKVRDPSDAYVDELISRLKERKL